MSGPDRYARQRSVAAVGDVGQAALAAATVVVVGDDEAARVAALYLAGAGVGRLVVHPRWCDACRALNSTIVLDPSGPAGSLAVEVEGRQYTPPDAAGPVARGARAARWGLARVLSR